MTGLSIGEIDRIVGNHAAGLHDDLDGVGEMAPAEAPLTKPGELYVVGEYRLICGDSLNPLMLAKLMDGETAA